MTTGFTARQNRSFGRCCTCFRAIGFNAIHTVGGEETPACLTMRMQIMTMTLF